MIVQRNRRPLATTESSTSCVQPLAERLFFNSIERIVVSWTFLSIQTVFFLIVFVVFN
jgi:hypothetical protein